MSVIFNTKKEAQDYINDKMKNYNQLETQVVMVLSDAIISQEHFSFFDFESNGNYNASILETQNGFQVDITYKKYSELVDAAEGGDLNLFKEQLRSKQSTNALSLAFNMAIIREKLNILQYYYSEGYFKELKLYDEPLITAAKNNKVNSFQFFIRKKEKLPIEILALIFHNNSFSVMEYIVHDKDLFLEVLREQFQTSWTKKGLLKKDNDATKLFKAHSTRG